MSQPLKRHSERVAYMELFIEAARSAKSMNDLATGRSYIESDLKQIPNSKIRQQAQSIFAEIMGHCQQAEAKNPNRIPNIAIEGIDRLVSFLEANDI